MRNPLLRGALALLAVGGALTPDPVRGRLCRAVAVELSVRDPTLTPGAVGSRNVVEVCAKDGNGRYTYSPTHRVWRGKPSTLAKYGIPQSQGHLVEDDDRVPLCAGGNNADPRNHWPQPWSEARLKDALEREVCVLVCDQHTMSLGEAQAIFLGDWREGYRHIVQQLP